MTSTAGHAGEPEEMSIVQLRRQLGRTIEEAHYQGKVTVVRRRDRLMAVLIPPYMWDELQAIHHRDAPESSSGAPAA